MDLNESESDDSLKEDSDKSLEEDSDEEPSLRP
jgi:hypothetical protein